MKTFTKTLVTLVLGMTLGSATLAAAAPGTIEGVLTKFKIVVNGEEKQLSNTPIVIKGTTYLPVREVAGLLDAGLNYDGKNKTIELNTKGANDMSSTNETTIPKESEKVDVTDSSKWISVSDFTTNNGVSYGNPSNKSYQFRLSSGVYPNDTVMEYSLPDQYGEHTVETSLGTLRVVLVRGATYFNIDDLKRLGMIQ